MKALNEKPVLKFVKKSLAEGAKIPLDFIPLSLSYVDIKLPSGEAIDDAVDDEVDTGNTTLRIQEINEDGVIIDQYELPKHEEEEIEKDEEGTEPTVYDKLVTLSRKYTLMKLMGDHNYRNTYSQAVRLIACQHKGVSIEDCGVASLGGPLASHIPHKKVDKLWNDFLISQGEPLESLEYPSDNHDE